MPVWLPDAIKQPLKGWLKAVRSRRRAEAMAQSAPHIGRAQLAADLRTLGVAAGDSVFLHSSLKSLGFVDGGPATVIAALQEAIGPDGTLLLPTYWLPGGTILGTVQMQDYVFDARVHGTNMGALPRTFLQMPGVRRSIHPTHSVSALGRHAGHLTDSHHLAPSVFGDGSPWQRFAALPRAKVLGLGISMGPVTFYHLLEDQMGTAFPVPVWVDEIYRLPCLDAEGVRCEVPVRPYRPEAMARRIDHPSRDDLRAYFAREFDRAGLRHCAPVGEATGWTIDAAPFLAHLHQLADEGITIYATPAELERRP